MQDFSRLEWFTHFWTDTKYKVDKSFHKMIHEKDMQHFSRLEWFTSPKQLADHFKLGG